MNTDAAAVNPGMDRQKYSSTFQKERADPNMMQYSNRTQPRDRLGMETLDPPSTRAQYNKMDADLSLGRTTVISSNRSDVDHLKSTHSRLTDGSAAATSKLGRFTGQSRGPASQNPSNHRAEILRDNARNPDNDTDRRYQTAGSYGNTSMIRDGDSSYINRQMHNAGYSSPRENYPPPASSPYSYRDRNAPMMTREIGSAQNRVGAATKKFSSPAEHDLRRSLYDEKYQMEVESGTPRRQVQVLAEGYQSHLSHGENGYLERMPDRGLDSARARYDVGNMNMLDLVIVYTCCLLVWHKTNLMH